MTPASRPVRPQASVRPHLSGSLAWGATFGLLAAIPPVLLGLGPGVGVWSGALLCLVLAFTFSAKRVQCRLTGNRSHTALSQMQREFFLGLTAMLAVEAVAFFLSWVALVLTAVSQ